MPGDRRNLPRFIKGNCFGTGAFDWEEAFISRDRPSYVIVQSYQTEEIRKYAVMEVVQDSVNGYTLKDLKARVGLYANIKLTWVRDESIRGRKSELTETQKSVDFYSGDLWEYIGKKKLNSCTLIKWAWYTKVPRGWPDLDHEFKYPSGFAFGFGGPANAGGRGGGGGWNGGGGRGGGGGNFPGRGPPPAPGSSGDGHGGEDGSHGDGRRVRARWAAGVLAPPPETGIPANSPLLAMDMHIQPTDHHIGHLPIGANLLAPDGDDDFLVPLPLRSDPCPSPTGATHGSSKSSGSVGDVVKS